MLSAKLKRWAILITSFLAGQGAIQLLNLLAGFMLLRWLNVEDYAQFSVAFGFQSTLGILIDLGFSGCIIALVGDRIFDKQVVGAYIHAGKKFRNLLFATLVPISIIVFPLTVAKHGWAWTTQLLLLISIITSLFFQGWASYYAVPLLMHKQLNHYYKPQIIGATARISLCYLLSIFSALSAWMTAWISSGVIVLNSLFYRRSASEWLQEPEKPDKKIQQEMLNYMAPLIPGIIFTAFQGQISVFLITVFGQTRSIAEVAALSRLGQLFMILSAFNMVILEPYTAKVPRSQLLARFCQVIGIASAICAVLCGISFLFPEAMLWVLGAKYQSLKVETAWVVVASSFNYIAGVIWTICSSRKWVYWWHTMLYISLLLTTQIICISYMKLDTTLGVIYFSVISSVVILVVHIIGAIYGFVYGHRQLKKAV